jgi:tRNA A37 threonylcarbamoyladenosine modification protein TsaB
MFTSTKLGVIVHLAVLAQVLACNLYSIDTLIYMALLNEVMLI